MNCPHEDTVCMGLIMCVWYGEVLEDRTCPIKEDGKATQSNRTMYVDWPAALEGRE